MRSDEPFAAAFRAAGLFAVVALIFFSPALLAGRVLAPTGDGADYYLPVRVHAADSLAHGRFPLWTPLVFGGFPFLADVEVGVFYPLNWPFVILPPAAAMNLLVLATFALSGVSTFLYVRAIGATTFGGVLAGLTYMLSGFMVSHLGHVTVLGAAAWLPMLLFLLESLRSGVSGRRVVGLALALALLVLGGHPQIVLHSLVLSIAYAAVFGLAARTAAGRRPYLLGIAAGLALAAGLSACQTLPTLELAAQSARASLSFLTFMDFSLPPSHLVLLLFPHLLGGFSDGGFPLSWWGFRDIPTEFVSYAGLTPLLLGLAVLRERRSPHALFWIATALMAIVLALGEHTPLSAFLYHVPIYNLFRAPARHLLEASLALSVLTALGASALERADRQRAFRVAASAGLIVAGTVAGLATLLCWRGPSLAAQVGLTPPQEGIFSAGNPALVGPLLLAFALACAWAWLARRPSPATRALAVGVALADLAFAGQFGAWRFSPRPAELKVRLDALASLRKAEPETSAYRVLSHAHRQDEALASGVATTGGSSSLAVRRFLQTLEGTEPSGEVFDSFGLYEGPALDLMNVRFVVVPDEMLGPPAQPALFRDDPDRERFEIKLSRRPQDRVAWPLPPLLCSAIAVTAESVIRVAEDVPLVRLVARTQEGERLERVLRAGWDAVPWEPVAPRPSALAHRSLADLGAGRVLDDVRVESLGAADGLRLTRVELYDLASRRTARLEAPPAAGVRLVRDPSHTGAAVASVQASIVLIVSALADAVGLDQGTPVARLRVRAAEGDVIERVLRAGEDTAEWAWDRPDVRLRVRHRKALASGSGRYLARVGLGRRVRVERVDLDYVASSARLQVDSLALEDPPSGGSTPVALERSLIGPRDMAGAHIGWTLPPVRASAVELLTALESSVSLPDGEAVARLSVSTSDGRFLEKVLRAGADTSEWAWDRPDVRSRVKHGRGTVASSYAAEGFEGHWYRSRLDLGGEERVIGLDLELLSSAALAVSQVALEDAATGRSFPLYRDDMPATLTRDRAREAVELEVPRLAGTSLVVVSRLSHGLTVSQGEPVARIALWTADGETIERDLRAGEHTSEWAWDEPEVRRLVRHARAPIMPDPAGRDEGRGPGYVGVLDLGGRRVVSRIRLAAATPAAMVSVTGLALYDAEGRLFTPLSAVAARLSDETRWRRRLGAGGDAVYENLKALPRAWLAPRVKRLEPYDVLAAVRTGLLPDGSPFEPREVALVEEGEDRDLGPADADARVDVLDHEPERVALRSRSRVPAFLVLSEAFYPGWTASVDGMPSGLVRTDYVLRGLPLTAGEHRVELVYAPASFRIGAWISGATLLGLVALALGGRGRDTAIDTPGTGA